MVRHDEMKIKFINKIVSLREHGYPAVYEVFAYKPYTAQKAPFLWYSKITELAKNDVISNSKLLEVLFE